MHKKLDIETEILREK